MASRLAGQQVSHLMVLSFTKMDAFQLIMQKLSENWLVNDLVLWQKKEFCSCFSMVFNEQLLAT